MKGIILAGGAGTRLYPLTIVTSKQLLPVYNKPMIYYPLSTLMLAKIREVLIISTPEDTPRISQLLGDGSQLGMKLEYSVQEKPEGLAQAFTIGKDFIGDDSCAMILGDNIFYGNGLNAKLSAAVKMADKGQATIFGYYVEDPERFGIMEFKRTSDDKDSGLKVLSVEEKPANPKSNYAIVGLYFFTWMDAGTIDSLRRATNFVCMIEQYQGMSISAPEEIAYRFGWINKEQLQESADKYGKSPYGEHLRAVLEDRIVL